MNKAIISCDGLAEPANPGHAIWAFVAIPPDDRAVITQAGYIGPEISNNVAEYYAVGMALKYASDQQWQAVEVWTDSLVVVRQVTGDWRCNRDSLIRLRDRIRTLSQQFAQFSLQWHPREQNHLPDRACRELYKSMFGAYPPERERKRS
jgi:ribonuclease HI